MANRSGHVGLATFPRLPTRPIFVTMAKNPDKPKKDPARPTRAKAARPDEPTTPVELANLLNPAIKKGTAGIVANADNGTRAVKINIRHPHPQ